MSKTVIKIENLSKIYRLGEVGTGTLSHDLNRWMRMTLMGQDDPYAKIGHVNDRTAKAEKGELIAALRDINLEVKEGEVLGIIGKNGAGKSTLLKLLSRVTSPTTGSIKVKGRMASLLEVGTGFHPEMTGRENIYMNGTIMGMRKWEIDKQLDAIVDFAGVAKYLDTPVKRYSSGMTVRLGFAIAAHLEPEILVVDEVLAVGDAEFQKKAIGKMQDVSQNQGRTVLFVSHNMASIQKLCNRGIMLQNGFITLDNNIENVTKEYIKSNIQTQSTELAKLDRKTGYGLAAKITNGEIVNNEQKMVNSLRYGEPFKIKIEVAASEDVSNINIGVRFENTADVYIASCLSGDIDKFYSLNANKKQTIEIAFNNFTLTPGDYKIALSMRKGNVFIDQLTDVLPFSVNEIPYNVDNIHNGAWGLIAYKPEWK